MQSQYFSRCFAVALSAFTIAACASSEVDPTDLFGTPTPDEATQDAAAPPHTDYGSSPDAAPEAGKDKDAGASKDAAKDAKSLDSSADGSDGAKDTGVPDASIPTAVTCDVSDPNAAAVYYIDALLELTEPSPEYCPCSTSRCCYMGLVCVDM